MRNATFVDRGESFVTRARIVGCVHGTMTEGAQDPATFLAIKLNFLPNMRRVRARMAVVILSFSSLEGGGGGPPPEVFDLFPNGRYAYSSTTTQTERTSRLNVTLAGISAGVETRSSQDNRSSTIVVGSRVLYGTNTGGYNAAKFVLLEDESAKTGIPEDLSIGILLKRYSQQPFRMHPFLDVKMSGFSLEKALTSQPKDEPVLFDPNIPFATWDLPFGISQVDRNKLAGWWALQITKGTMDRFLTYPLADVRMRQGAELRVTPEISRPVTVASPNSSGTADVGLPLGQHRLMTGFGPGPKSWEETTTTYTELWNNSQQESVDMATHHGSRDVPPWIGWDPDPINEVNLSTGLAAKFKWVNEEVKLEVPDVSSTQATQHVTGEPPGVGKDLLTVVQAQDTSTGEVQHTLCSLLLHKASSQTSFKSFQDLSRPGELLDQRKVDLIAQFFTMDEREYNGFRRLDFGSCEILSTGEGRDLEIAYIVQTPYYSSGFWSLLLLGKADPQNPDRARKLSGLLQAGADVSINEVLRDAAAAAPGSNHHPLLIPYHLYLHHYKSTSDKFDAVHQKVQSVEQRIMNELRSNTTTAGAQKEAEDVSGGGEHGEEPNHWGLAKLSNSLHEASMEVAELVRRRRFEDELAKQLQDELKKKRPPQNQMLLGLQRYDRWAKAHQLDIEGMPGRIDSLKTLVYSMIAQQDNVVSIRLAQEGLSDSKAMKTLSVMTILFLPGTFVATIFTTNLVSFKDAHTETMTYIKVVIPLTVSFMIAYGLWLWGCVTPTRSRLRRHMLGDLEAVGNGWFPRNIGGRAKQS